MKKIKVALVALGLVVSFIGAVTVSAKRAETSQGTGCFVKIGEGEFDYAPDAACTSHEILKMNDDGSFDFYVYQDHGQLPAGGWRPTQMYRNSFDQCINFSFGTVCGQVKESVTPSGEYKSSFKSY